MSFIDNEVVIQRWCIHSIYENSVRVEVVESVDHSSKQWDTLLKTEKDDLAWWKTSESDCVDETVDSLSAKLKIKRADVKEGRTFWIKMADGKVDSVADGTKAARKQALELYNRLLNRRR